MWIVSRALARDVHDAEVAKRKELLDTVNTLRESLNDTGKLVQELVGASSDILSPIQMEMIAQEQLSQLKIQLGNLEYGQRRGVLRELYDSHVAKARFAAEQLDLRVIQWRSLRIGYIQTINATQAVARAYEAQLAEQRERRVKRVEQWLAVIGVALGMAEIIDNDFAQWLLHFVPGFSTQQPAGLVALVRFFIVALFGWITFLITKLRKP
jgi:hypothetical protein